MAKKRKGKRKQRSKSRQERQRGFRSVGDEAIVFMDYYWGPFVLLHKEYERAGHSRGEPHSVRERYWRFAPPRQYEIFEARPLLGSYLELVEREMAETISRNCLGYWLHLYRRIWPGPIGSDTQPQTIGLTRALLEAAIQKHGTFTPCHRVGCSHQVPSSEILGGLLEAPAFSPLRDFLSHLPDQLVLTDFTSRELAQFYDLEKLAYEGWLATATLRAIAKGANLVVQDSPASFNNVRSAELSWLLHSYDERRGELHVSSTGTVFEDATGLKRGGLVFLPTYNLDKVISDKFPESFWRDMHVHFEIPVRFNFIWQPFNLRGLRNAHTPLADAFRQFHGVSMDAVLTVVATLCARVFAVWWSAEKSVIRYWQHAYEGPLLRDWVRQELRRALPMGLNVLGIDASAVPEEELTRAISFWELTDAKQGGIDLPYSGPHYVFLPFGADRWFIDYAWILRRLYDLFVGVSIDDQNFKGDALEQAVRQGASVLPTRGCKAADGSTKQIDAAFTVGDHLVIVECKAVGRSIAYDRGDPPAIEYRLANVVERGLEEADAKATWLSERPIGRNYDLAGICSILPVVASPFVEFIPSRTTRYWVSESIPRVLTPGEIAELLKDPGSIKHAWNRVRIRGH